MFEENIVSKAESEIRLFKLSAAFSVILLSVCCVLSIVIDSAGNERKFIFFHELDLKEENFDSEFRYKIESKVGKI